MKLKKMNEDDAGISTDAFQVGLATLGMQWLVLGSLSPHRQGCVPSFGRI
jgi:hypothetical protein